MSVNSNVSHTAIAVSAWDSAVKSENKGDAHAIYGLAQLWSTCVLVDTDNGKRPYPVAAYAFDPVQADGKTLDQRLRKNMGDAILSDIFGLVGEAQGKHKMRVRRAHRAASYIANTLGVWSESNRGGVKVVKDSLGNIPLELAIDIFNDNDKRSVDLPEGATTEEIDEAFVALLTPQAERIVLTEQAAVRRTGKEVSVEAALEAVLKDRVVCDGRNDAFYGQLPDTVALKIRLTNLAYDEGYTQAPPNRNGKRKVSTLVDSINALDGALDQWLRVDESNIVAPTEEQEAVLFKVSEKIAAYFAAHPRLI